jgi:AcrR family transcriptional regulator
MPRVAACPDVHQAILDAAKDLMERYGYKKMTIDDIAREAGIGKATIYGYFARKQDVALAVVDSYHRSLQDKWREIASKGGPAPDTIRRLIVGRVLFAFDVTSRYRDSFDDAMAELRSLVIRQRGRFNEVEAAILAEVVSRGVKEGDFKVSDPLEVARTILTCVSGLMPYSLSSREFQRRDEVERMANQVVSLIFDGLLISSHSRPQPIVVPIT